MPLFGITPLTCTHFDPIKLAFGLKTLFFKSGQSAEYCGRRYPLEDLELDTIYYVEASAEGYPVGEDGTIDEEAEPVRVEDLLSDKFLLYEVKEHDLVTRIARHYGTNPNDIARDNHLYGNQLTEAGTILFIRNPQTADPYSPDELDLTDLEALLLRNLLLGDNPYCVFGLEPINFSNGNFYMVQEDSEIPDLNDEFGVTRSYNSALPDYHNEFGYGWSSDFGEHLTILPDGTILYKQADGKGIPFYKNGDEYLPPEGYDETLEPLDSIEVDFVDVPDEEEEETEEGTGNEEDNPEEPEGADQDEQMESFAARTRMMGTPSNALAPQALGDDEESEETTEDEEEADREEDNGDSALAPPACAGWKITRPDGTVSAFDALGFIRYKEDRQGHRTTYVYDTDYNLVQVKSPSGKVLNITMDEKCRITQIELPDGNILRYEYDENGNLVQYTNAMGDTRRYEYDEKHRMTAWYDEKGNCITKNVYDDQDRVVSQTDALGSTATLAYSDGCTVVTDNRGNTSSYYYDGRGRTILIEYEDGTTCSYTYNAEGYQETATDELGNTTSYTYDENGNILTETREDGSGSSYTYNELSLPLTATDYENYTSSFTYDEVGNLLAMTDGEGNTTTYGYDELSRLVSITDANGGTESYTYDGHGNMLSVNATNGLITQFNYDILDNLIKVTLPSGLSTSYAYDEMGNVTSMVDTMGRMTTYTYDIEGNMTSLTDAMDRKEQMTYDAGGRQTSYTSNGGNRIDYDYDVLNDLVEKSYEDERDPEGKEDVVYGYDVMGQRVSMMDRSGESSYEYDGLGRITKVTTGSGETTTYEYGINDMLSRLTYPDGKSVSYEYDLNDNLTQVTDRTGGVTTYVYDAINRVTEIHRPNGISTYNTYNARDQIVSMKNICDDCGWVVSQYDYTYDDRGFIVGEDAIESLYGYAWDDKHDGKHENGRHDDLFPHGGQHTNKHAKDGEYNFQIVETTRTFTYDEDGKLLTATENEEQQGRYDYVFEYDDMGNRTYYGKSRNGVLQESGEYTYNAANQLTQAKIYDGKKNTTLDYEYDADGNRISETGKVGTDKVENTYIYTVENRLKAVYDADDLLVAMAYDGDGNRIFQLNYNLHTDDDWKGNNGNGNGNNKDNKGQGGGTSNGTSETAETSSVPSEEGLAFIESLTSYDLSLEGVLERKADKFTASDELEALQDEADDTEASPSNAKKTDKKNDNGNNGNNGNGGNGNHYGWENGNNGNSGNNGNGNSGNNGNGNSGNNGNGNGNSGNNGNGDGTGGGDTTNTGGSTNQSGILFPIEGEVSELEQEMIDMIKTDGKHKDYELIEYVNDVNREHTEVLMELNINGIMDTAYSYGNERLTVERFDGWTGFYTYDPRGSVSGVTGMEGYIWQSYRYDAYGNITFGKPQYNNVYGYNAESYNPNLDAIYLRARYYNPTTADFMTEDSYLGDISDPLTLNRYSYVKASPLNYIDPSGHSLRGISNSPDDYLPTKQEIRLLPTSFYGEWKEEYNRLGTDERKWEYLDILYDYIAMVNDDPELQQTLKDLDAIGTWAQETTDTLASYCAGAHVTMYLNDIAFQDIFIDASQTPTKPQIEAAIRLIQQDYPALKAEAYRLGELTGDFWWALRNALAIVGTAMLVGSGIGAVAGVAGGGAAGVSVSGGAASIALTGGVTVAVDSAGVAAVGAASLAGAGAIYSMGNGNFGKGDSNSVKPEAAVTGSKKHGVNWKEGPARAKATGNPQGQWAKSDLDYATEMANTLKPGESGYFDLPEGSQSIVHMPDGTTQSATRMWIRNNGTGTWHGYPMP